MVAAACCDFLDAVRQAATDLAAELEYYASSAVNHGDEFTTLRQACADVLPDSSDPEALARLVHMALRAASMTPITLR